MGSKEENDRGRMGGEEKEGGGMEEWNILLPVQCSASVGWGGGGGGGYSSVGCRSSGHGPRGEGLA